MRLHADRKNDHLFYEDAIYSVVGEMDPCYSLGPCTNQEFECLQERIGSSDDLEVRSTQCRCEIAERASITLRYATASALKKFV
jgi:hypothetical protein